MSPAQSGPHQILIRFDDRIITLPAVKKAAYKYINSFAVDFSLKDNEILCSLTFTPPATEELALRLAEDFKKEALDQDLREQIKTETEPIRNLIFALAFSKAGIVGNEQVPRD
jgi:His-Xaa-Ser system protein HxsD